MLNKRGNKKKLWSVVVRSKSERNKRSATSYSSPPTRTTTTTLEPKTLCTAVKWRGCALADIIYIDIATSRYVEYIDKYYRYVLKECMCSLYDYVVVYREQSKERQKIGDIPVERRLSFVLFSRLIYLFKVSRNSNNRRHSFPTYLFTFTSFCGTLLQPFSHHQIKRVRGWWKAF